MSFCHFKSRRRQSALRFRRRHLHRLNRRQFKRGRHQSLNTV
jgi:hypothetical protein